MNALEEFKFLINTPHILKCATIKAHDCYTAEETASATLRIGYTPAELLVFLEALNFEYDSGYGSQELFGIVWFEDNTWAVRYEFGGAECWEFQEYPRIPEELR
jgi:hypothetical protein